MKRKALIEGSSLLISELSNYNRWLAEQINRVGPVRGTILELGCGTGGLTQALVRLPGADKIIANDISPDVKDFWAGRVHGSEKIEFSEADILKNPEVFAGIGYDMAISSNSLEHIEDDSTALRRMVEYARLKTAIILVPALDCLYGTCDRDGGHYRRYSKESFRGLARKSGVEIEKMFYFNMLGALGWWLQYVLLRTKDYGSAAHSKNYTLFDRIVPFYSKLERQLPCPFGLSLVVLVKKGEYCRRNNG